MTESPSTLRHQPSGDALRRRRMRRAFTTTGTTVVARAVSFSANILLVPLTVPLLGKDLFGAWMVMLSISAFLAMGNLGIGYALISLIARADARGDRDTASRLFTTGLAMTAAIAGCIGLVVVAIAQFVDWSRLLGVTVDSELETVTTAMVVLFVLVLISLPLSIVPATRLGYQEGYVTAGYETIGSAGMVAVVAVAVHWDASLPVLVAAAAGVPLIATAANGLGLVRRHAHLRPRARMASRSEVGHLIRPGLLFFALQGAYLVGVMSDNIVGALVLGASAVSDYAVSVRVAYV